MARKPIKKHLDVIDDSSVAGLAEQLLAEGVEDGMNSFMPHLAPNDDVEMLREAGRRIVSPPHTVESARFFDEIYRGIERRLIARGRLPKK